MESLKRQKVEVKKTGDSKYLTGEIVYKIEFEEGCLSVPGFYEKVDRYNAIEYTARDINGKEYQNKCEALLAVCVQHEIDHLNGKLFVDYLSLAKRENFEKNMKKMISEGIQTKREKVPYSI